MQERLEQINTQLRQLQQQAACRRKLERQQEDLQTQRQERQIRVEETGRILQKEEDDVERLERVGLRALLASLSGDKEARLSKERREAYAARCQYEQAQHDLEIINEKIQEVLNQMAELRLQEGEIQRLLEEKAALLKQMGGEVGAQLMELDRQMTQLECQRRETAEALSAGQKAEQALCEVLDSLDAAESWGTWDMLGGGLLSTMAKHGHLDDARAGIDYAQQCLSRFRTELSDVSQLDVPQVQIGEFATFADYFFDGLFADWYVQSGIHDAQDGVSDVHARVLDALRTLEDMKCDLDRQEAELNAQRSRILEQI